MDGKMKFPLSRILQWTQGQVWREGGVLVQEYGLAILKLVEFLSNGCFFSNKGVGL